MIDQRRPEKYRWVVLVVFGFISFANGLCWVTFAPITINTAQNYEVSTLLVNFLALLYPIIYLPINFPSNWILDSKGLRAGMLIGGALTFIGSLIRVAINKSFIYVIVGQTLLAAGQPFILNAPAKIGFTWFNKSQRPLAIAILSVWNILGSGIGYILPTVYVDQQSKNQAEFQGLMFCEMMICAVSFLAILVFFQNKEISQQPVPILPALKSLFKNTHFLALLLAFSFTNGTFNTQASLSNQLLRPFGLSDDQVSFCGAGQIGMGLVGAFVLSVRVQKTGNYRSLFWLAGLGSGFSLVLGTTILYFYSYFPVCLASFSLLGFFLMALIPLSFDYGCLIEPLQGQAMITGLLMTGGQVVGIIQTLAIQGLFEVQDKKGSGVSMGAMGVLLLLGQVPLIIGARKKVNQRESLQIKLNTNESII